MLLEVLPEWILSTLKRPDRINRTPLPVPFKKEAIKIFPLSQVTGCRQAAL